MKVFAIIKRQDGTTERISLPADLRQARLKAMRIIADDDDIDEISVYRETGISPEPISVYKGKDRG